ncbi:MAG: ElyC/SanA/YdcF family protein [Spirochaetaceae bacterium]
MAFLVQKLVSRMLFPVPLVLLSAALGTAFILLAHRRAGNSGRRARGLRYAGSGLIAASFLLLGALSVAPVADALLGSLERRYEPLAALPDTVGVIVVLGAGHIEWDRFPDAAQPGDAGLARIAEAVRLARGAANDVVTVFTGFAGAGDIATAEVARRTAVNLGLPEERTRTLREPRNTREEARAVAAFLHADARQSGIALVTSAFHMPRALREFAAEGIEVIPAPAGYRAHRGPYSAWSLIPNASSLQRSERAWYEYMGLLHAALVGR